MPGQKEARGEGHQPPGGGLYTSPTLAVRLSHDSNKSILRNKKPGGERQDRRATQKYPTIGGVKYCYDSSNSSLGQEAGIKSNSPGSGKASGVTDMFKESQ